MSTRRAPPLAINCRFLEKETRGIGRYATGLARRLRAERPDAAFLVSRHLAPTLEPVAQELGVEQVGPLAGPLWEQLTLPVALRRRGRPLLLNLVNTAPFTYGKQATVVYDIAYRRCPEIFTPDLVRFYRLAIPRAVRHSRVVVTLSEFVRQELVAEFGIPPERVHVVPGFVAPHLRTLAESALQAADPAGGDYALMVSVLNARKNFRNAILGFRRAAVPGLRLVIVGAAGNVFRSVELDDLMGDDIVLAGAVEDDALMRLYAGARLLLYPSLYEGFGLPPVEAMACGCPVVAARRASIPEVCGDAARYCDPLDPDDIADAIAAVAGDDALRAVLRARGLARAAALTLDASYARLADALRAAGD